MKTHLMIAIVLVAAGAARADDAAAPRALTFHQAIELALAQHPLVRLAADKREVAALKADGPRAQRLPSARVDGAVNTYTDTFEIVFGTQSIVAREDLTSMLKVSVTQPLTGLGYLSEVVGTREHEAAAAGADYDRTRLDVAYHAAELYVRALEARAAADVAHQSVASLGASLDRAKKLREAETYSDIDVLRFQSAKAAADQVAVRADSAAQIAAAELGLAVGLHDGLAVGVVDDLPAELPALAMTEDDAQRRALSARPELHALRERIDANEGDRRAARDRYLPVIAGTAAYEHITGFGDFQPANSFFAGLTLSWNVWDWGQRGDDLKLIAHARSAIEIEQRTAGDTIRVEVQRRWLEARSGHDSLAAVATQLQAAEEAYRLQKVRFDAGASTASDVLDAETDVARARLAAGNARYDYFLALVALARAVGDLPGTAH